MTIQRIDPPGLNHSPGFPQTVVARGSRFVFINGQVGKTESGELVGAGDPVAQAEQAFRNLKIALAAAGATGRDVAQWRLTVVGYSNALVRPILQAAERVFGDERMEAASIFVGATALGRPEYLVEVEAIAVLD